MIKKLEDRIIEILESHPKARDSDQYLLMALWVKDLKSKGYDPKTMGAWELLKLLGTNELPNQVSVFRCRQKVQEINANLRGKKYEDRQKHSKTVKEEIKNWTGELF